MFIGDNMRRAVLRVAILGAITLACDIVGRVVRFPYEIPIGTMMESEASYLYLLLRRGSRLA